MTVELKVFDGTEQLKLAASQWILDEIRAAIARREQCLVSLAGGSTPKGVYQQLASLAPDSFPWPKTVFFFGDERSVPPDHADSNYRMARLSLLGNIEVSPENVIRMEGDSSDLAAAAQRYEQALAAHAPDQNPPRLDLVLLGMGDDGHTASLFPHTAALAETERWVVPNEVPQLATWRLTFTYPLILAARKVLFFVTGSNKAERLAEVLEGSFDPTRLPSQRVFREAGHVVLFSDSSAAADLSG